MVLEKDSDVFIENGELIEAVIDIQEALCDIQKWLAASGTVDIKTDNRVGDALHDARSLYRCLIDIQIGLLTFA